MKQEIEEATGIPTTTCVLSLIAILKRLGARTQALVTPYTDDVQARIIATYAAAASTARSSAISASATISPSARCRRPRSPR